MNTTIQGKKIAIHTNGQLFVNGKDTGLFQWRSDATRWKDRFGSELKDLKGKSLEMVLKLKGYIHGDSILINKTLEGMSHETFLPSKNSSSGGVFSCGNSFDHILVSIQTTRVRFSEILTREFLSLLS